MNAEIIVYAIIPLILAITLHEAAHGWVARQFGDSTAYQQGRVTLNPLSHIDLVGTIIVPIVTLFATGFLFGWAKPVPVRFGNLRKPKIDSVYVAAAGPFANLLMAVFWSIMALLARSLPDPSIAEVLYKMGYIGVVMNISFMVFNLIPVLPLDGGRILAGLLPTRASWNFSKTEPYGMWIVLILVMSGVLKFIIPPIVGVFQSWLM